MADELDGVEIKINFGASQIDAAMQSFGLHRDGGKTRRIWFGENRNGLGGPATLPLSARGIILRFREKKNSDATLKLRGPDGCIDVTAWRERTANADAKIEGDWAGERRLVSASLDGELDDAARNELHKPKPTVVRLLTDEQRRLAHQLMIPLAQVDLLGPIEAIKWEPEHDGDIAAELWDVSPQLRFLELSILVTADPTGALEALEKRVVNAGLKIDPLQDTKTSTVLRHLATGG